MTPGSLLHTPTAKFIALLVVLCIVFGLGWRGTFAGLLGSSGSGQHAQEAFQRYYGKLAADPAAARSLHADIDTILGIGTTLPGHLMALVHEFDDPAAENVAGIIPTLKSTGDIAAWTKGVSAALHGGSALYTYSLVRRIVVAALLRVWLTEGQKFSAADDASIVALFKQLYDLHRRGTLNKGVMEYLHISKSGGTSWCHVAQLNGCLTQRYDKSYVCQIKEFDDKVRWLNMSFHKEQVPAYRVPKYVLRRFSRYGRLRDEPVLNSCRGRHAHVHRNEWNYYSNEYTVHGGFSDIAKAHICKDLFNAIIIRDPNKRLVSHMKFIMWTMSGDRGYNDTQLFKTMYDNRSSAWWQGLGPAVVDNYYIRSLLGEKAYHLPVGQINRQHRDMALQVLLQFDLLMVLEQEVDVRDLVFYYGAGWVHTLEEVHDKDSTTREALFDTSPYVPKDLSWLLDKQELDNELYRLSQVTAALDPVVFEVAKAEGIVPLPELETADAPEQVACGMLRGRNGSEILKTLPSGQPGSTPP